MSNQTKEQKQKRIEKFKNTWNNRTEAQILLRKKRISESLNNRTIEQKQQAIEKFKISYHEQWLQKSQEQKDREISKMLQTKKIPPSGRLQTSKLTVWRAKKKVLPQQNLSLRKCFV